MTREAWYKFDCEWPIGDIMIYIYVDVGQDACELLDTSKYPLDPKNFSHQISFEKIISSINELGELLFSSRKIIRRWRGYSILKAFIYDEFFWIANIDITVYYTSLPWNYANVFYLRNDPTTPTPWLGNGLIYGGDTYVFSSRKIVRRRWKSSR